MESNVENIHKQYFKCKMQLENLYKKKNYVEKLCILVGVGLFLSSCVLSYMGKGYFDNVYAEVSRLTYIGIGIMVLPKIFVESFSSAKENELKNKMLDYEILSIQNEVQNDIFENSIKMSYKYLDQYYLQTRIQAKNGFNITVGVSVGGSVLITTGVLLVFLDKLEPAYITCVSGVITEFIAAIFFYLYNKTVISMSKYHNKLVLSHNISTVLKLADTFSNEEQSNIKKYIITQLLCDINSYLIKDDLETNKGK